MVPSNPKENTPTAPYDSVRPLPILFEKHKIYFLCKRQKIYGNKHYFPQKKWGFKTKNIH
jgi:hypothetical protein